MMDAVVLACRTCGEETLHAVLKASPNAITAQCDECETVQRASPRHARTVQVRLIVSAGEASFSEWIETPTRDEIGIGDEFDHNGHRLIVTALEVAGGHRRDRATTQDVRVVFSKLFDLVEVPVSINRGERTTSHRLPLEPDDEVHIGEVLELDGHHAVIKTLKSDQNRTLHKGFLLARNVRRAFCDPAPAGATPGAILKTRKRGAPTGAPKHSRKGPGSRR